jgi:hypothetical protein
MDLDSASLRGELRCRHMFHNSQRTMEQENKERLSYPNHADMLACSQGTLTRYRGVSKTCGQAASS